SRHRLPAGVHAPSLRRDGADGGRKCGGRVARDRQAAPRACLPDREGAHRARARARCLRPHQGPDWRAVMTGERQLDVHGHVVPPSLLRAVREHTGRDASPAARAATQTRVLERWSRPWWAPWLAPVPVLAGAAVVLVVLAGARWTQSRQRLAAH